MTRRFLFSLAGMLWLAAVPAAASVFRMPASPLKAGKKLQSWVDGQRAINKKLAKLKAEPTARAARGFPIALEDMDLKDALADAAASAPSGEPVSPQAQACLSFSQCPVPPLEVYTRPDESPRAALLAMLTPWMWLAQARGSSLLLTPAAKAPDSLLLTLSMPDLNLQEAALRVESRPEGGLRLWFERSWELAELYSQQRGVR